LPGKREKRKTLRRTARGRPTPLLEPVGKKTRQNASDESGGKTPAQDVGKKGIPAGCKEGGELGRGRGPVREGNDTWTSSRSASPTSTTSGKTIGVKRGGPRKTAKKGHLRARGLDRWPMGKRKNFLREPQKRKRKRVRLRLDRIKASAHADAWEERNAFVEKRLKKGGGSPT